MQPSAVAEPRRMRVPHGSDAVPVLRVGRTAARLARVERLRQCHGRTRSSKLASQLKPLL